MDHMILNWEVIVMYIIVYIYVRCVSVGDTATDAVGVYGGETGQRPSRAFSVLRERGGGATAAPCTHSAHVYELRRLG